MAPRPPSARPAPRRARESRRAPETAARAVKGGHTRDADLREPRQPSRTAPASASASASVVCIFQLPATTGVRGTGTSAITRRPGRPRPAGSALQVLEERTAARREIADPLSNPGGLDGGHRVSAADDREGRSVRHHRGPARASRPRTGPARRPHRAVPDDGLHVAERVREVADGRRADVESHQVGGIALSTTRPAAASGEVATTVSTGKRKSTPRTRHFEETASCLDQVCFEERSPDLVPLGAGT